jgi:hypothetical protein
MNPTPDNSDYNNNSVHQFEWLELANKTAQFSENNYVIELFEELLKLLILDTPNSIIDVLTNNVERYSNSASLHGLRRNLASFAGALDLIDKYDFTELGIVSIEWDEDYMPVSVEVNREPLISFLNKDEKLTKWFRTVLLSLGKLREYVYK